MNKVISIISVVALCTSAVLISGTTQAQGRVGFDTSPRGPGAGYNNTRVDRRVAQPKSILKGSRSNRAIHREQRFMRKLGPEVRGDMRHRGDVARHARNNKRIKSTLANKARPAKVRFNKAPRGRGAGYSAKAPHNKVFKPKGILKNKSTLKTVKHGRKLRTVGKVAAGGFVVAGGTMVAEEALGVDIPDAVDAAEWTYGTLKNPRNAPKRFERLGRDSLRTIDTAGRTLTNPKKLGRNLNNGGKKLVKSVNKAGCSVGKLFGAKC